MRILITGAGGFVGGTIAQYFSTKHATLSLSHRALDVTDSAAVRQIIRKQRPNLIINCAVLGVDDCELNPALAHAVNVEGPRALAAAAVEVGAEFLHFSTNYVFDGECQDGSPYTYQDIPEPINEYGRTKLAGERMAQAIAERSYIIRTSWVFGPGGKNFLGTAPRQLMERKPLRAVTDISASATYIGDLLRRIEEILARQRYGIYHVVNEEVCSHYEFALEVADQVGLTATELEQLIAPVNEAEMKRVAPRPRYTPLRCLLSEEIGLPPLRSWRAALLEYSHSVYILAPVPRA